MYIGENKRTQRLMMNKYAGRGQRTIGQKNFFGEIGYTRYGSTAYGERGEVDSILARMLEYGQIKQVGDTYIINDNSSHSTNGSNNAQMPSSLPPTDTNSVTSNLVTPDQ